MTEADARVSEHYNLGKAQTELDFVDVDLTRDTELYVDPRAILQLNSSWSASGVRLKSAYISRYLVYAKDGAAEGRADIDRCGARSVAAVVA